MKKQLIIATIAAMAFIATACSKKTEAASEERHATSIQQQWEFEDIGIAVNYSEIDPIIMQFVETHFPQTSVFKCHQTQYYYKVKLLDGTKLKFTHSFDWIEVDCEHATIYVSVPTTIVPTQITDYVTVNHPDKTIEDIEKKSNGNWEVELRNGPELKFDANFNVIGGGNNGGGNGGNTSNYPEINTFVATYFPLTSIKNVKIDGNEIEVKLTDKTEIDFYSNFDWKSIDCEKGLVYGSVPAELVPEQITAYVAANFAGKTIESIEKKHNGGWEIELSNGIEIEFDRKFRVIEID